MEQAWIRRRLLFENFDSAIANPSPNLPSYKSNKHYQEPRSHILPEYCHSQARLCNGKPCLFIQLLDLDRSQGSVAQSLKSIHQSSIDEEDQVCENLLRLAAGLPTSRTTYHQAQIALRQIHTCWIKICSLVKCRHNYSAGKSCRNLDLISPASIIELPTTVHTAA